MSAPPPSSRAASDIIVTGIGAVSPAGWDTGSLWETVHRGEALPTTPLARPGWGRPLPLRRVPPSPDYNPRLFPPRLRRSSFITHLAHAAAMEALGGTMTEGRLGVVFATMSGSVNYSRRFYEEVLEDPELASPVLFPETVFNAPASHLASVLGATVDYTLVGDITSFLDGLAVASAWLGDGKVDRCLVVAAEEHDWLTADAFRLFSRRLVAAEGAAALCLARAPGPGTQPRLEIVTRLHPFTHLPAREEAAEAVRTELDATPETGLLCDGAQGVPRLDAADRTAWQGWKGARLSPKRVLGEGLAAAAGWMCVAALKGLAAGDASEARVAVNGLTHQAAGVRFRNSGV